MITNSYCKLNNRKGKDRILVPSDDYTRNIGEIKGGIFIKYNFQSSKHICHKYQAIGLDSGAFENYILPNAREITCTDRKKDITYRISVSLFSSTAISDDLGWGTQIFCPLKYFQVEHGKDSQYQMDLNFGGIIQW